MRDKICSRGIKVDERCQTCGLAGESINHVFFTLTAARQVWVMSNFPIPEDGFSLESIYSNMAYLLGSQKQQNIPLHIRRIFPWIVWEIWKTRNTLVFEGKRQNTLETMKGISSDTENWFEAQAVNEEILMEKASFGLVKL